MVTNKTFVQRSGRVSFRPHARLIRLLGDELISDEVMALVELVKNGYDADASQVIVRLDNITDPTHGVITIRDDGYGMDLHTLLNAWMEPATSHKRQYRQRRMRTPRGRVQLGEKGVGRFAADKLGTELELITRCEGADEEIVLKVSWHHFDQDNYLDEIENVWFSRESLEFMREDHGTQLQIRSLRTTWNQEMVTKLNNGLARLVSPSAIDLDFLIEIDCPEFPFASGRVVNRLLESAPYRLSGTIDETGVLRIHNPPEHIIDLRLASHNYFATAEGKLRIPCCGPFSILLNVWDLELLSGKVSATDRSLREAIKSSSGVSIYRDGFRIWPYGEKDDDWLELNQRRVNNPTLRVSNNQIIGFVEITQKDNPDLRDRTSREGLLDTPAFFDLKVLVLAVLSELETERFARRRQLIPAHTVSAQETEDELLQCLSEIRNNTGHDIRVALQEIERLYRQRLEQERTRYNQVSRLAGTGMAAELLTEAFSREISNAAIVLHILQNEIRAEVSPHLGSLVETLTKHMETINEQLDVMGPLYRTSHRDNELVNIRGVAYDTVSILTHRFLETGTQAKLIGDQYLTVRVNRGHIMQALMILLENALTTMKEFDTLNPRIEIRVVAEKGFSGLIIADNGPGIAQDHYKLIFEPFFSTRKAGRGLGLHVARDILTGYNSSLELVTDKSSLPGACFAIRFDGRRVTTQPIE